MTSQSKPKQEQKTDYRTTEMKNYNDTNNDDEI